MVKHMETASTVLCPKGSSGLRTCFKETIVTASSDEQGLVVLPFNVVMATLVVGLTCGSCSSPTSSLPTSKTGGRLRVPQSGSCSPRASSTSFPRAPSPRRPLPSICGPRSPSFSLGWMKKECRGFVQLMKACVHWTSHRVQLSSENLLACDLSRVCVCCNTVSSAFHLFIFCFSSNRECGVACSKVSVQPHLARPEGDHLSTWWQMWESFHCEDNHAVTESCMQILPTAFCNAEGKKGPSLERKHC